MLKAVLGLAVAAGVSATFFVGPANADPYKWCAIYGGRGGGATNCGFVTLQQCQATIRGAGGTCEENPRYTGGERRRAPKRYRD
jgi:hypothetical protein